MVLACVNRRSSACEAIHSNEVFCVNLLASHQGPLSDAFAGRPRKGGPFDFGSADWQRMRSGTVQLADAVAAVDCILVQAVNAGTHTIFIGWVVGIAAGDSDPLAYHRRFYCVPKPFGAD